MPDRDGWKVLYRTLPDQVRENWMEVESRIVAVLGLPPLPHEGRSDDELIGRMTTVYELLGASILLMDDETFEAAFGITARRKR